MTALPDPTVATGEPQSDWAAATAHAQAARELGVTSWPRGLSSARLIWRRFRRHRSAVVGAVALAVIAGIVAFGPLLAPYPLNPPLDASVLAQAGQGPSLRHVLGTDELGRDELTRIINGGRVSLAVGLAVALLSTVIGTAVGAVAGYFGGWTDQILMRINDLLLVIPGLAVLMIVEKKVGGSLPVIILVLALLFWHSLARIVHSSVLSLRSRPFIDAARAAGARPLRIIIGEILPNAVGPILVYATVAVSAAILTESALSFLGFGLQPPSVSWGTMLAQSRSAVGTDLGYLVYAPGGAILLTVLAVNLVGSGLRDVFDPRTTP